MKNFDKIIKILKKESRLFKQPVVTELANLNGDPFLVLISCIISLRTKDDVTRRSSLRLFVKANTPLKISKLKEKEIADLIYPAGFYNTKAKTIHTISNTLLEKYAGNVPRDFDELLKLKGVGKKTAAITMVYGFNDNDYIPVDVHVHVIVNRVGIVNTKGADQTMEELMKKVPKRYWHDLNDLFVSFGQNICTTVSPFCSRCPIFDYCKRNGVKKSRWANMKPL